MANFLQYFSGAGLAEKLQALNESRPKVYLGVVIGFILLGYLFISLPPLMLLISFLKIINNIGDAKNWDDWSTLLKWLVIGAGSGYLTYLMLRLHVSIPRGLGLKTDKAPPLYELLDELQGVFKHPKIHRVVLHDQFSLDFIPVPRFGLPLLTINVLYIGLPVLQGLSSAQFRGLLSRKLGQYSMAHNRLTHWAYRFQQYAGLYQLAYQKQCQNQWFYLPFKWFFQFFVPLSKVFTIHAIRMDELEADNYGREIMNDDEFADTVIRYEVAKRFLQEKFYPKVLSMIQKNPQQPDFLPHSSMAKVLRNGLTDHEVATTLETLIKQEPTWDAPLPGLHTRLDNMGHRNLTLPPPVLETAAQRLLGASFAPVVKLMDQQWLAKQGIVTKKNTSSSKKTEAPVDAEQALFQQLSQQATHTALDNEQLWQLATLTEKFVGQPAAIGVYQKILKHDATHSKTWFAIGRILLLQKDVTGVKALERAIELDHTCSAQACWMLAKYFKANGKEALAKQYIERAARSSSAPSAA